MDEKNPIKGTIFEDYDTIILDLDQNILDCFLPNGTAIGVYQTTPPYSLKDANTVVDLYGRVINLQEGVRDLLDLLDKNNINLGIVSRSEVRDMAFEAQPAIMILKKFDIYKYFNYEVILKLSMNKAEYVKPLGKTLFIDDWKEEVDAVNARGDVDVLWRRAFAKWETLLEPKNQQLGFGKMSWRQVDPTLEALEVFKKYEGKDEGDLYRAVFDVSVNDINIPPNAIEEGLCYDIADRYLTTMFYDPIFSYLEPLNWVSTLTMEDTNGRTYLYVIPDMAELIHYCIGINDLSPPYVTNTLNALEDTSHKLVELDRFLQEWRTNVKSDLENPEFWQSELAQHMRDEIT
jgi:predicted phosphatase